MNCWNGDDSPACGSASVPPQVEDWTGIHGPDEGVNIGETTLLIGVGAGPVDLREKAHDLGTVQALRWHLEPNAIACAVPWDDVRRAGVGARRARQSAYSIAGDNAPHHRAGVHYFTLRLCQ